LRFHDRQLRVRLTHEDETYSLSEGEPLEIVVRGRPHFLGPDDLMISTEAPPPS
jgi:hypothetical protein